MSWWDVIAKPLTEGVTTYINRRQDRKIQQDQMKNQLELKQFEMKIAQFDRQIELKKQGMEMDANWEMEFARQAASTWKDEYTLIVVSIPAVLAFIPKMAVYVAQGFKALQETPMWYQVMLCSIFLATYGIRYWRRSQSDT